jgi:hypothetical protein
MDKNIVVEFADRQETPDPLTKLLRRVARELLQQVEGASLDFDIKQLTPSTIFEAAKNCLKV